MKIRITILTFLIMLCSAGSIHAQSNMTEKQLEDYIKRETLRGTSQAEITKKAIERGVPLEQLRRIRDKFAKQKREKTQGHSALNELEDDESRTRLPNGQDMTNSTAHLRTLIKDGQLIQIQNMPDQEMRDSIENGYIRVHSTTEVFGRNIFNNKWLTFESDMNLGTPGDYRLGGGDVVNVDIWGNTAISQRCTVSPDGDIIIEGYGPVHVGGLTVADAQKRLKSTVGSRYQGNQIKLTVGQTKTITISVFGEVNSPGTYTMSAFATVLNALYMAGGINTVGTLRNIKVLRGGREVATADIYDFILNGKGMSNIRLQTNDVIYVGPYDCLVQVQGKVRRPMFYEMRNNESVATLIKYAGGFTGDAYEDNVHLTRKKGGMLSVYTLDEFERGTFQLADADSVFVDSTLNRYSNMVEIKGAVRRPGKYQMDGGVTTVRSLIEHAGGLNEEAFGNHAVMHRRKENRQLEVLSLNVAAILAREEADVTLRNEDALFIPTLSDYNAELTLTIHGEVQYPGIYDFADNTTIEDLVLQAGGLTDAASTMKVDVTRRFSNHIATEQSSDIAQTFSFSLRDGFVVNGERGFVLKPYDEVFIRRAPNYNEQKHITIKGEINYPGIYVLTKKNMRLSEVISQAGGITDYAYAHGARLERALTPEEKQKAQELVSSFIQNSEGDENDNKELREKLNVANTKTVGIELDMALQHPEDSRWDVVLQDGDEIFIPGKLTTVDISGEVLHANTVTHNTDMRACDYINLAGGYSTKAKKKGIYAINPNGMVQRLSHYSRIEPGATIVVPAKRQREKMNTSQILSMGMSLASLGAVIVTAIK